MRWSPQDFITAPKPPPLNTITLGIGSNIWIGGGESPTFKSKTNWMHVKLHLIITLIYFSTDWTSFNVLICDQIAYLLLNFRSSLYTLDINLLSDIWFANIFFHSMGCLIILILNFIYFCGTGDWTQGFFFFPLFLWDGVLLCCADWFSTPGLQSSSCLSLLYAGTIRHVPPHLDFLFFW
jgi:hypothetical protein